MLLDTIQKNLKALSTLGEPTEHWDNIIIYLTVNKLDSITLRYWEENKNTLTDMPTLECFKKFIKNCADLLETLQDSKINNNPHHSRKNHTQYTYMLLVQTETFLVFLPNIQKCLLNLG